MNKKVFAVIAAMAVIVSNCIIIACNQPKESENQQQESVPSSAMAPQDTAMASIPKDTVNRFANANVEVRTFKNTPPFGGWGYDILINDTPKIHQPNIPSVPGNDGFTSEDKAKRAAGLMVYKIKNNIMPPALTPKELDSLGALN